MYVLIHCAEKYLLKYYNYNNLKKKKIVLPII